MTLLSLIVSTRLSYAHHKHAKAALKAIEAVCAEEGVSGPNILPLFTQFCFDALAGRANGLPDKFPARLEALTKATERLRPDKPRWLVQSETILHLSERLLGMTASTVGQGTETSIEVHRLRRKDCGTYSTPNHIVDNIVRRALLALKAYTRACKAPLRVVDLSAEAGHFALATLGLAGGRDIHFHAFDRDIEAVALHRTMIENAQRLAGRHRFSFHSFTQESVMCHVDELPVTEVDAVIGNPPWKIGHPTDAKSLMCAYSPFLRARFDVYLAFLLRADQLLRKGGVLGMVLPNAFLHSDSGAGVRRFLLDRYDAIYLATYPRQAFVEYRGIGPVIILLRKKGLTAAGARTRIDIHTSISEIAPPRASYEIDGQDAWRSNPRSAFTLGPGKLHAIGLGNGSERVALAEIGSFSSGAKFSPRKAYVPQCSFIGIGAGHVSSFLVNSAGAALFTPSSAVFDRPPPIQFLAVPKVFFKTVRCISLARRLVAAVGGSGQLACSTAAMFMPADARHADFIAGLLNSVFANAWYKSRDHHHSIKISVLKELEIPHDEALWQEIASCARELSKKSNLPCRNSGHVDRPDLQAKLDELVFDLYSVGQADRVELAAHSAMRPF